MRLLLILFLLGCSEQLPERRPTDRSGMFGEFTAREVDSLSDSGQTDEPSYDEQPSYDEEPSYDEQPSYDDDTEEETENHYSDDLDVDDSREEEAGVNVCFSYLDCPHQEACNIVSSTCYLCTEDWQCNNQYDLQQTGPSYCCTEDDIMNERCGSLGSCQR